MCLFVYYCNSLVLQVSGKRDTLLEQLRELNIAIDILAYDTLQKSQPGWEEKR